MNPLEKSAPPPKVLGRTPDGLKEFGWTTFGDIDQHLYQSSQLPKQDLPDIPADFDDFENSPVFTPPPPPPEPDVNIQDIVAIASMTANSNKTGAVQVRDFTGGGAHVPSMLSHMAGTSLHQAEQQRIQQQKAEAHKKEMDGMREQQWMRRQLLGDNDMNNMMDLPDPISPVSLICG